MLFSLLSTTIPDHFSHHSRHISHQEKIYIPIPPHKEDVPGGFAPACLPPQGISSLLIWRETQHEYYQGQSADQQSYHIFSIYDHL
jgi:hypothetical protein